MFAYFRPYMTVLVIFLLVFVTKYYFVSQLIVYPAKRQ